MSRGASRGTLVLLAAVALATGSATRAQERTGTLTLDSLSYLSFDDEEFVPIPAGTRIRFRFGEADERGSVPFTIAREDLSLPQLALSNRRSLSVGLSAPGEGSVRRAPNRALVVELHALVETRLDRQAEAGVHSLRFTTETALARNLARTRTLRVSGMRLDASTRAVQLVATTTGAREDPKPGAAIYVLLSGTFDAIPEVPDAKLVAR
jgi:hypothetical protein